MTRVSFVLLLLAGLSVPADPAAEVPVDLSRHDPACGVRVERRGDVLRAEWETTDGFRCAAGFRLAGEGPLIAALETAPAADAPFAPLAKDIRPEVVLVVGSRTERANERYIFFDKPAKRPHDRIAAVLDLKSVRVESAGRRVAIAFSTLSAGPFSGELIIRLYAGSPFLHLEAAMAPDRKGVAYIYDVLLAGDFPVLAWKDTRDRFVRESPEGALSPRVVRHRTILAELPGGSLAVFPPPHAFFFPRDHTDNFGFVQAGKGRFGLRQDPDRKNDFVPWFDAPAGKVQRMGAFVLLHPGKAEAALERALRYTRGDTVARVEDHLSLSSHWHARLSVAEMAGKSRAADFVRAFKALKVDLVHLAEFHGDGTPLDPGPKRLPELQAMFDVCRRYSDAELLLIPGEEANAHFNKPAPAGQHPGHWMYLFPTPVYLTLVRPEGAPLSTQIAPYGTVYHTGGERDMMEVLWREQGLAWTSHPRIKASFAVPDAYKDRDWYRDPVWLGAAWKAMPGDLSEPRLGRRALDVLDDMCQWGQKKYMPGEVDGFEVDPTHELYGHMNVNYVRCGRKPTVDEWSGVVDALRRGDFWVTTGEVLVHDWRVSGGDTVIADLSWTFPPAFAEVVWGDGKTVRRRAYPLDGEGECGRRRFAWEPGLEGAKWVRLEAWDVAGNGAFTQPAWLGE
jgi:hypothetical protein